jgi:hypothetical protein
MMRTEKGAIRAEIMFGVVCYIDAQWEFGSAQPLVSNTNRDYCEQ